eukprot:scaffold72110_cov21-Tisochrysis_lutea.AAC.1
MFLGNAAGCPAHLQNALEVALEGCEAIERVYRKGAKAVDDLKEVRPRCTYYAPPNFASLIKY